MGRNIFNSIALPRVDSNRFDLSHDVKLSFKMGQLVPTMVMDVLPGDQVSISAENMLRFAPLIAPIMHKVNVATHYFFVPNRILWDEFPQWITGETDTLVPVISGDEWIGGSLSDYMGVPPDNYDSEVTVSAFPFAAYVKIWDEYFRDQNLQSELFNPLVPGSNNSTYLAIANSAPYLRAWSKDYFTASLPTAQQGSTVAIPLTVADNVNVDYQYNGGTQSQNTGLMRDAATGNIITAAGDIELSAGPSPLAQGVHVGATAAAYDPNGTLSVDVNADATDINTLRRAFKLQEWLEKNIRGGVRYVENILSHFGVRSSDARLQRPEYLGSVKQNMVISEVLATAQSTTDGVAVGSMAGHGISVGGRGGINFRAEEHGWIIGVISVIPQTAYQDGIHRSLSRDTRLDYAWPVFANIGEQEVLRKEVYANSANPDETFGYVPRYAEYRFMNSRVAGEFRDTLDFWHLGRKFLTEPSLNDEFIQCVPDSRIFAVTDPDDDHVYAHVYNNVSAVRKLPRYGIPSI